MKAQVKKIINKVPFEIKYILALFFLTRLVLVTIGVLSRIFLEPFHGQQYVWKYSSHLWLDIWGVWDSGYYMNIAHYGYSSAISNNPATLYQANYAFFPLYPLLIRLGHWLSGNYLVSGIIISNVCFLIASYFLYRLIEKQEDQVTARNVVKYLFLFPTAFIFSGVFTESLFLMLLILAFYLAQKRKWYGVGICGFFLTLTRSIGIFMLLPLVYEYAKLIEFKVSKIKFDALFFLFFPAGLMLFAAFNFFLTKDPLGFVHIQSAWGRHLVNPVHIVFSNLFFGNAYEIVLACTAIICLGLVLMFYDKLRFSYFLLALLAILVPLFSGLASLPRYVLIVFPLYIIFAKLSKNSLVDQFLTITLALLQGFLMVFWSNGFEVVM